MKLGREKVNHISKLIIQELDTDERVTLLKEANEARIYVFKAMLDQLKIEEEIDDEVRRILSSYTKKIVEGSAEWDVMYSKQLEEELNKRKL